MKYIVNINFKTHSSADDFFFEAYNYAEKCVGNKKIVEVTLDDSTKLDEVINHLKNNEMVDSFEIKMR